MKKLITLILILVFSQVNAAKYYFSQASGEPIYDIAEKYATGVINDHPNITSLQDAVDTAVLLMMFVEIGLVPEAVGSSVNGQ